MTRTGAQMAFVAMLIAPAAAMAMTQNATQMMQRWSASDRCVAQAHKTYPDYSPKGIAERDRAIQQCLGGSMLPPRQPQAPGGGNPQQ